MVTDGKIIKIGIASPGDVDSVRQVIADAIEAWNAAQADTYGVVLRSMRWETNATPEMGDRAQAIINKQVIDQCDALIAVFWNRLGTPTGEAVSGTAEEIERLVAMGKRVAVYFSDQEIRLSEVDLEQRRALEEYKQRCRQLGLLGTFSSEPELRDKLQGHLTGIVKDVLEREKTGEQNQAPVSAQSDEITYAALVLAPPQHVQGYFSGIAKRLADDLAALQPDFSGFQETDEAVMEQISSSRETVDRFLKSAETATTLRSIAGLKELSGIINMLLPRTHLPEGVSGSYDKLQFDGWKFIVYDLYVGLVATVLKSDQLEFLDSIISQRFYDDSAQYGGYRYLSRLNYHIRSLDDLRNQRLGLRLLSVVGEVVKDLYSTRQMPITHREFMAADYLLFIKTLCTAEAVDAYDVWVPQASLYMEDPPPFVRKAESKGYLLRLASALDIEAGTLVERLAERHKMIGRFFPGGFVDGPLEFYDFDRLGRMT